ncbi:Gmad2 immunoglobulin-like domain-containing protein [Nocardioides houyundeii]|uniref:Gmad2 immunoglobulin-like domain-containing protein n=1 Tax=Nocardioides houyundeii TaxID=2045452 RepID=UPI000C76E03A|nr:Gmad2 immunoglobulin-like domain-containing protein [Nocardioides houyundeii]
MTGLPRRTSPAQTLARPLRRTLTRTLAATALLAAATGCGAQPADPETLPAADSASSPTQDPSVSASPTPAPAETVEPEAEGPAASVPAERTTVGVYFVGDAPSGPRLFREFRSVSAQDPLTEAAALLTSGDVLDPDYRTLFPRGSFGSVRASDGMLVVELADGAWVQRPRGMTREHAELAVQQLLHTLQAVIQARAPMTVLLDGVPSTLLGVPTAGGVTNADPLEVLALVNVTSPEQGSRPSGSLRATGVASSPEANVPWEIRRGQEVVMTGFATAEGWMDKLYPWQTEEIDVSGLAKGSYTFVASTDDPSDGEGRNEGGGPTTDSKDFTLR